LLVALLGWYRIRDYINFSKIHTEWWPQLIRFGAPLLPSSLAIYFMSSADRWFVQYYHGEEELGLFAIGAKFSMFMVIAVDVFRKAWWPIAMDSIHSDDGPETIRIISQLYVGLTSAFMIVLTLISPVLVEWIAGSQYRGGWIIVGILSWQAVFYGFYLLGSIGIWKTEKTYLSLYLMLGASALGILLNWLLVKDYGIVGAALSTSITYLVWVVASVIVSEKLWKIGFPIKVILMQLFTSITATCFIINDISSTIEYGKLAVLLLSLLLILSAVPKKIYHEAVSKYAEKIH